VADVSHSVIAGNYGQGGGGAIAVARAGTQIRIDSCYIEGNRTDTSGGGLLCESEGSSTVVTNTVFVGNMAAHIGGAILLERNPHLRLINCTITENFAPR
jgi:hypothetical protein